MREPLLACELTVRYGKNTVVDRAAIDVFPGEIVGVIGHSGSGKSSLSLAIMRLGYLKGAHTEGRLTFEGRDILKLSEAEMRRLRGKELSLVLQSPVSSLNPALSIGTQMREAWRAHAKDKAAGEDAIRTALQAVALPATEEFLRRRPGQVSVGQAQRVLIATGVLHRPKLLIVDEPTSALDYVNQAEVLELFRNLREQLGVAVLFISHDLLAVAKVADRVAVMQQGRIVEFGTTEQVLLDPQHEHTRRLLASLPVDPQLLMMGQVNAVPCY
ncbi:MAG TPA: ABC transporter ATP-binding protein [Terriglobales bacterium]